MTETNTIQQTSGQGFAVTSLVLGILAVLASAAWYLGIILGILAAIFGIIALKSHKHGMAIAGIITGGIGVILSILVVVVVYVALPALQKGQRDAARKMDVSTMSTDVVSYQGNHQGQLPAANDLSFGDYDQITAVRSSGSPTTDSAVYSAGKDCDNTASTRAYSIRILLESGATYCQGS